jgi:heavy metal sensor kinase
MRVQSIRWRLQLWYGLLLAVLLAGFGMAAYEVERDRVVRRIDGELRRRLQLLVESRHPVQGANPPRQQLSVSPKDAIQFDGETGFYYAVWLKGNARVIRSATAPPDVPTPDVGEDAIRIRPPFREVFLFPAHADCLLVGRSTVRDFDDLHRFAWRLIIAGGAVLLIGVAGGAWLVARALLPIRNISAAAQRIATGDLTQRIDTADSRSELGQLVGVLNSTFARLDTAFTQQARFTADAAHELRTPVSILLMHAQNGLASECANEEHREAFEASQRAAQRMRRLIESLLELARLDAGQEPVRRHGCNLAEIAAETVDLLRPIAAQKNIQIHADLTSAEGQGDAERLTQAMTNLLTNAIEYNFDGGEVFVTTNRYEGGSVALTVANTGPGISGEDLPRIFDRFHRADKARGGAAGHSGLGLAITKAIVQAHGGSITAQSEPGKGATFTVILPA